MSSALDCGPQASTRPSPASLRKNRARAFPPRADAEGPQKNRTGGPATACPSGRVRRHGGGRGKRGGTAADAWGPARAGDRAPSSSQLLSRNDRGAPLADQPQRYPLHRPDETVASSPSFPALEREVLEYWKH